MVYTAHIKCAPFSLVCATTLKTAGGAFYLILLTRPPSCESLLFWLLFPKTQQAASCNYGAAPLSLLCLWFFTDVRALLLSPHSFLSCVPCRYFLRKVGPSPSTAGAGHGACSWPSSFPADTGWRCPPSATWILPPFPKAEPCVFKSHIICI